MNFFRDVVSHLIKNAFEGHTKFSVCDNTAIGDNPIRSISLDAVPVNEEVLISLAWDGGEKLFEKKLSDSEASHQFDLISTDLAEVASLAKKGEYDSAKDLMGKLAQKYTENTGDIVPTNMPKLNTTQASKVKMHVCPKCNMDWECTDESCKRDKDLCAKCSDKKEASQDSKLWKEAKVTMQNLFFSSTDELLDFQKKMKELQSSSGSQDNIPLWDQNKKAPKAKDELAPPSMSYEDLEEQKEKEHENMEKHIDETIKTELESALQEKAASVFGPADVELVKSLRAPGIGRNWDEIKKIFIKDLNRDKDSTNIFLDEQRKLSGDEGVEVKVEEEKPETLTPPEELVSPETHEKLLQDIEEKKNKKPVEEVKEKEIEKVEPPIKEESSKKCPHCNKDIWDESTVDQRLNKCWDCGTRFDNPEKESNFTPQDIMAISELDEIARADNTEIRKVAFWQDNIQNVYNGDFDQFLSFDRMYSLHERLGFESGEELWEADPVVQGSTNPDDYKVSSLKKKAADDLNPLQEPIEEKPTLPTQDVVPMEKPLDHNAPQKGDRVFVSSDLNNEKAGFEATFISTYKSKGTDFSIVETDDGDLLDIESHRVVKTSEGSGAQVAEPVMEPKIEAPTEEPIQVTPSTEKLTSMSSIKVESDRKCECGHSFDEHTIKGDFYKVGGKCHGCDCKKFESKKDKESSQDELLLIKAEAEALLKEVQSTGKISYLFVKKGLEKHAGDSAYEANGWTRVWVDESEIEVEPEYEQILKLPDEAARIQALKELARKVAQDTLSTKANAGGDIAQMWFDSLKSSDHDRIDWVRLANPKTAEQEEAEEMAEFNKNMGYESSLESKLEKTAKFYVGVDSRKPNWEVFESPVPPTQDKFPYNAVIGPFKTQKGAEIMATYGRGNPHLQTVEDAERMALKEGSDFEKGISQNKTSELPAFKVTYEDGNTSITNMAAGVTLEQAQEYFVGKYFNFGDTEEHPKDKMVKAISVEKVASQNKTADEPAVEPKTKYKELKRAPAYTDREQAIPATPELDQVLEKMDSLEQKLSVLDTAKKQIQAKLKEELAKIDQQGERMQMEAELQASIDKAGILIDALENKVVSWRDKLYTMQTQEISYVPNLTPKEMLEKVYAKFAGAEAFVTSVLNGMQSQAKNVIEKTLVKFPSKKSSLVKEASVVDTWNDELLQALKELSSPL